MNYVFLVSMIFALLIGWIDGGKKMKEARNNPNIGVKPSNSLFTYLFLDK